MASQIITLSLENPNTSFGIGEQIVVNVTYNVDNADATLTGIGFRIHFDNTELRFDSADVDFTQSLFGSVNASNEVGNDNDTETNQSVNWRYADFFGQWPNTTLPLSLGSLTFTTLSDFDGTNLNVTFSSTVPSFTGIGNSLALVNDVNETPTDLALSATTVNENVPVNTVIGTFSTTDPDSGNTFTYSLIAGTGDTDNSAFSIVGNQLQINNSPDFETKNSYSIRVKTTDQGGLEFEKTLTITVNDVNETPTDLALSATTVNENVPPNTVIGTFSSTDPDTGNTFTYSLIAGTGDTDNTAFSIVGNQLQINNSPDFETKNSYSIRVKTTDQGGLSFEKTLTIVVNNVNETPTDLVLSATTVNENVPVNTV
ncbi:cadherin repeat domain-containing protein, partial [Microcystis sp. T1-4]|uniref:cadherin repeat domain-containing protein n=1 Tax=Microcystis sp. T1-4 TaxID=1160279 RepID=UPI0018DEE737